MRTLFALARLSRHLPVWLRYSATVLMVGLAVMLRLEDMDGKVATRMTISPPECEKQAQLALAAH